MTIMNASKKARYVSSISNQNNGGGSKKQGLPYQIGKSSWSNIAIRSVDPVNGRCCSLANMQMTVFSCPSRPIGRNFNTPYWKCPGV